ADGARVVRDGRNAARVAGSLVLLPFYLLGGLAGDDRGPLLPLAHRCSSCGHAFRRRSVVDEVRSWVSSR
ncbi:MAG: hypothetical protein R2752_11110, partial [Vicinamibacterales bacterium]